MTLAAVPAPREEEHKRTWPTLHTRARWLMNALTLPDNRATAARSRPKEMKGAKLSGVGCDSMLQGCYGACGAPARAGTSAFGSSSGDPVSAAAPDSRPGSRTGA